MQVDTTVWHSSFNFHISSQIKMILMKHWLKWKQQTLERNMNWFNMTQHLYYILTSHQLADAAWVNSDVFFAFSWDFCFLAS